VREKRQKRPGIVESLAHIVALLERQTQQLELLIQLECAYVAHATLRKRYRELEEMNRLLAAAAVEAEQSTAPVATEPPETGG